MLVFHGEFSGEISSTDLKLLASQGFSQIDDIIEFKELFTRRDIDQFGDKCRRTLTKCRSKCRVIRTSAAVCTRVGDLVRAD